MAASSTDLRKLVKIASIKDLYDVLERNGPSKHITQELTTRCLATQRPSAELGDMKAEYRRFNKFAKYASCVCPNVELVRKIAVFADEILEVGAGTGLWAKLLGAEGCKVTATDIAPPALSEQFTKVIKLSCADALKKYPQIGCLMMCSPEISFPATDFAGDRCVILGGDPAMALLPGRSSVQQYSLGYPVEAEEWELVDEIANPTWWGETGLCRMYRRRTPLAANENVDDAK